MQHLCMLVPVDWDGMGWDGMGRGGCRSTQQMNARLSATFRPVRGVQRETLQSLGKPHKP